MTHCYYIYAHMPTHFITHIQLSCASQLQSLYTVNAQICLTYMKCEQSIAAQFHGVSLQESCYGKMTE